MDTKEKNRRSAGSSGRNTARGKKRPAGQRQQDRSRVPVRRKHPAQKPAPQPVPEEIPEVTYTMPKPFSKGGFLVKLVSVAAVVAAVVMCLSMFFRVESVVVSGADKYTPWMVKEASGLTEGDSLLSVSDARVSGNIISALPYVKEVRVGIKLPGTVHIEITELETTYAIEASDSSWWLITSEGRVVERIQTSAAAGYTRIYGVQADSPKEDQIIRAMEEGQQDQDPTEETEGDGVTLPTMAQITGAMRLDAVITILNALEDNGVIGLIASIDVTNINDITMEYGQRLHVVLGTAENLDYKVQYMALAIAQIEEYQTGELDVSFKYSDKALVNPET